MAKPTITNVPTRDTEQELNFSQNGVGGKNRAAESAAGSLRFCRVCGARSTFYLGPRGGYKYVGLCGHHYDDGRRFNSATLARGSA